jgi:mannosyltransferase OCH1-like enzyme
MESPVDMIPKNIFTSVPNAQNIDERLVRNYTEIAKLNPGWTHTIFDDFSGREFIQENYDSEILRVYLSINRSYGAARADFFRYLLIYNLGGVWLDAKSTSTNPFSNLIQDNDQLLLSHWSDPTTGSANELFWGERSRIPIYEFQNWWLIARPKHPSFEKLIVDICKNIDTYSALRHGVGRMGVLCTTGPLAFTRSLYPTLTNKNHRIIEAEKEGLVYTIFDQIFTHRSVIGTNYGKVKAPLVSAGWRGSLEAFLADSFMTCKRVIRKLKK